MGHPVIDAVMQGRLLQVHEVERGHALHLDHTQAMVFLLPLSEQRTFIGLICPMEEPKPDQVYIWYPNTHYTMHDIRGFYLQLKSYMQVESRCFGIQTPLATANAVVQVVQGRKPSDMEEQDFHKVQKMLQAIFLGFKPAPFTTRVLHCRAEVGVDIHDVAVCACADAKRLNAKIHFDFNGTELIVEPSTNEYDVVAKILNHDKIDILALRTDRKIPVVWYEKNEVTPFDPFNL